MLPLAELFLAMPPSARALLALSLVAASGVALGHLKIRGVGLGIGGVLFTGIAGGHLAAVAGIAFDTGMMDFIRDFGLLLFVYTIGIQVGPGFFAALRASGLRLNLLALLMGVLGIAATGVLMAAGLLPTGAALGVFAGATTNAPALAAAQQVLSEIQAGPDVLVLPGLAFAVTYPFGIAGNLLAMALVRAVFRIDPEAEARAFEAERRRQAPPLHAINVAVRNAAACGAGAACVSGLSAEGVVASRLLRDGTLCVPQPHTELQVGDVVHLVGPRPALDALCRHFGEEAEVTLTTTRGTDLRWERIVVTASTVIGKPIGALEVYARHHAVISRLNRAGVELVPNPALKLQFGDILTVIGRPDELRAVAQRLGNSQRRLQQVEMVPTFIGLALGVILGTIPLFLPGLPSPLRLGLAGGPLIVAILLGRLGHLGPLVWFMPPAANLALREIGIVLFLAVLGLASGARFVETLASGTGLPWMAWGVLVTALPLAVTGVLARAVFRLNFLSICGLLAGAQTNPPGLAYANVAAPSEAPATAYASVYPLSMCLRILGPQLLVLLLG